MSEYSKACCTLPPAEAEYYTPKGTYKTVGGLKTYVTGETRASKAIFWFYDVFGYSSATIQGADIIAAGGYLVVIPDMLKDRFAQMEWYTRQSEEDKRHKEEFMQYIKDISQHLHTLHASLSALKDRVQAAYRNGAALGSSLLGRQDGGSHSGSDTPWTVGVQTSPGLIDPKDAEKITTPHMMLASGDESVEQVKAFELALKTSKTFETFTDQKHGWMSARADLKDARCKEEYERGYSLAVGFFQEHL